MSAVSRALGVSRSHLSESHRKGACEPQTRRHEDDAALLARIRTVIEDRPTNGYRRVTARLNQQPGFCRVNHKRVYRVMREHKLLLQRHAPKPTRTHDGKIITIKSDVRWCSDMFEIRCWDGSKVHVAFSLDCCDREVIAWHAAPWHLSGLDVRDLMAQSIEARFGDVQTPHPVQWLSDNGPQYTANETKAFGTRHGLIVCNTPSYSPESNGMAEAFVKTFKRDFVYLADLFDADSVIAKLPDWFEDYNETHPHKGLKMLSPRQFRKANLT